MEKITKCIISLLNLDKRLFTNKYFINANIVDLYDKFVELTFNVDAKFLYTIYNISKNNETFFKIDLKGKLLYVYFMIPNKYHFIVTMGLKDDESISKSVLNLALDYWTF